jgi:xanthine/uracil permease
MDFEQHHRVATTTVSNRKFGFTVGGILFVLGFLPLLKSHPPSLPLGGGGALLMFFALIFPAALAPLNKLWMRLGDQLHRVVSPIILGIVFFAVVTPIGLIRRMFNRDPLHLRFRPDFASYWQLRPSDAVTPQSLRNQF